jgi:outer membrane protein assembly factor BamA
MRPWLAQIVVLAAAGLLAGQTQIRAQQSDAAVIPEVQDQSCPRSSPSQEAQPSGPEVSIDSVTFSGFLQMPVSDQDEIAASIRQEAHGDALDRVIEEALERTRAGWQNRGYFKVQVTGDARTLKKNAADVHVALFVHVDEGVRYTLGAIAFKHNKAISNVEALRGLFPINDGEIFGREKIAKGLENLRKAYGQYGYINYTGVPATTFDDDKKLAFLEIDVDEGKQYFVDRVNILGFDELAKQKILSKMAIHTGDIYNARLWELSLMHIPKMPDCECRPQLQMDEHTVTVAVTLDFRPCSSN